MIKPATYKCSGCNEGWNDGSGPCFNCNRLLSFRVFVGEKPDSDNDFVIPLTDEQAVKLLVQNGRSEQEARVLVKNWRKLAIEEMNYRGNVAWQIRTGFNFKEHAPQIGNCYKNWEYLQDWTIKGGTPITENVLAFWIPCLVKDSVNKNVSEQKKLLVELRVKYNLPENYISFYGDVSLLSGLILTHNKLNNERVSFNNLHVRTDTFRADGYRLSLGGFGERGLGCGHWAWRTYRGSGFGCFLLGVELLNL